MTEKLNPNVRFITLLIHLFVIINAIRFFIQGKAIEGALLLIFLGVDSISTSLGYLSGRWEDED